MTAHVLVRFTVADHHLDRGELSASVVREIRARFFDVPPRVWCALDVGAALQVDHALLAELAQRPCARWLRVEAVDYRVAQEAANTLREYMAAEVS